jgi:TonB family protein
MNALIFYGIKAMLCMAVFYGFYLLLLRKMTFFSVNRFYLLGTLVFSFILPFISLPFTILKTPATTLPEIFLNPVVVGNRRNGIDTAVQSNALSWLTLIYCSITAIFLLRLMLNIFYILWLYHNGSVVQRKSRRIVKTRENIAPFSFFNLIFIPRSLEKNEAEGKIISHEFVHSSQFHSVDIVLLQIINAIFWFNPFIYAYRASLSHVHEYLADRGVLNHGINMIKYQQTILNQVFGTRSLVLANTFNHSIKRRFIMMTKNQSRKTAKWRVLLAVPLSLMLIVVFSSFRISGSDYSTANSRSQFDALKNIKPLTNIILKTNDAVSEPEIQTPQKSKTKKPKNKQEVVFTTVEQAPGFPGGEKARMQYMLDNIKYPQEAKNKGIHGTVYVSFTVKSDGSISDAKVLRGIGGGCDEEALRVVNAMPKWAPGKQKGKDVDVQFNMPIKFALDNSPAKSEKK